MNKIDWLVYIGCTVVIGTVIVNLILYWMDRKDRY